MMNKNQLNRLILEKEDETLLAMQLGETYVNLFREMMNINEHKAMFYWFAYVFEWGNETGVHKFITKIRIGDRININPSHPVWPVAAVVEGIDTKVYLRTFERETGQKLERVRIPT